MPLDPSKVVWDTVDPKEVKWDTPVPRNVAARKAPRTLDVATNAPYEALAGIPDTLYGAPQNLYNLGAAAFGTAATAMGRPDLAPEVSEPPTPVRNFLAQQGYIKDLNGMTPSQQALSSTLQAATGGLLSPTNSLRQAAVNATRAGMGGFVGDVTAQTTGSPTLGIAAGMAAPAGITSRQQQIVSSRDAQQAENAVRDATLRAAQKEGYVTPPGNIRATTVNKALERVAGKTELQQIASAKNQTVTNRLARQAVGISDTAELTPETMKQVRNEAFNKGYAPIENIGRVPVDNEYLKGMQDVEAKFTGAEASFPEAIPPEVRELVNRNLVDHFDAADAMARMRSLRSDAKAAFAAQKSQLGKANNEVAKILEDQIERHLATSGDPQSAKKLADFRAARKRMAISYTLEEAMREGTGAIDARKLAAALNRGAPLTGDLKNIATFASAYPNVNASVPGSSGTPGVGGAFGRPTATNILGALLGAGLGGVASGGLGAVVGAAVPSAARSLAQKRLLQPSVQANALNYGAGPTRRAFATQPTLDPALYNALIASPIARNNAMAQ